MKKKFTIILSVFALMTGSIANAQAVEQGNIIIDPYYGFPNVGANIAKKVTENKGVKGIGPAGVRAEYMVADNFGVGVDFIYNSVSYTGSVDSLNTDGTTFKTYDVKTAGQRYRVHLRLNYHFVSTDEVDAYVGLGVGTNTRRFVVKTDYPNYDDSAVTGALFPVSFRIAVGMRYYFTDNIGANLELGLGGPLISTGISLKF